MRTYNPFCFFVNKNWVPSCRFNVSSYLRRPKKSDISHMVQQVYSCEYHQQGVILIRLFMPKVKTNSSAKKRFKVTGTGEITFQKAFKRHILTKKTKKRKRSMRMKGIVGSTNKDFVQRLLRLK